ncbi:MAG: IS1595 family transposase [Brevundimonas sp.]|uniref:IS1595 family transposase n=1 Tax=Brevundimonas sp. TaxID=1871086 RepID=UPI0027363EDC|nr:IS1595 family transposase [Brevundimonas sp.]MDP3406648.1 IS1595 family transposase [Brevundimonas sp.]
METKSPKPLTLRQFQDRFPTEEACLEHLMRTRYGQRHTCAKCEREAKYYRVKARRSYECEHCGHQVYPTAGTPFEKTRTSLRDWFHVMFLFTASRNGVSAKEVQRTIGVTYKTAWRMARLIRSYMGYVNGDDMIGGPSIPVETDKTFVGGYDKKGADDKKVVLGMVERDGRVIARHIPSRSGKFVVPTIVQNVRPGGAVVSDAARAFEALEMHGYHHHPYNALKGEKGGTSVIEGFWGMLKRGINGTYISVSQTHLQTYLGEFEFRYNLRKQPHMMLPLLMTSFARGA